MPAAKTNQQQRKFILRNLTDLLQSILNKRYEARRAAYSAERDRLAAKYVTEQLVKQVPRVPYVTTDTSIVIKLPPKYVAKPVNHSYADIAINGDFKLVVRNDDRDFAIPLIERLKRLEGHLLFLGAPEAQMDYETCMAELKKHLK